MITCSFGQPPAHPVSYIFVRRGNFIFIFIFFIYYFIISIIAVQPPHQRLVVSQLLQSAGSLPPLSVSRPRGALTWGLPVPGDDRQLVRASHYVP